MIGKGTREKGKKQSTWMPKQIFCLRLHIHGPDRVCMLFCVANNKRANARITNRCDFMSFPHIVALKADIGRHLHYLTCVENKTWAIRRLINRGRDNLRLQLIPSHIP